MTVVTLVILLRRTIASTRHHLQNIYTLNRYTSREILKKTIENLVPVCEVLYDSITAYSYIFIK